MERQARGHPTRLVNDDDLSRPRGIVFFRLPLARPHLVDVCRPLRYPSLAGGPTA